MFKGFMRYLFGTHYEKAAKGVFVCLLVFFSLREAGISIPIAPAIMYLMTGTVTFGSMWQDLTAKNQMLAGKNLFMLPFSEWRLKASYVGALGSYTFLMRTGLLLSVVLSVSAWRIAELAGCLLGTLYGILISSWIYGEKKCRRICLLWIGSTSIVALWLSDTWIFYAVLMINSLLAVFALKRMDAYAFYEDTLSVQGACVPLQTKGRDAIKNKWKVSKLSVFGKTSMAAEHGMWKRILIWKYFFRYLRCHKNYLINILILWGAAAGLPLCFGEIDRDFVFPIGCALLTINTPVCILLSGDPDLEQVVRTLPGQKRSFLLPYGFFLFLCNLTGTLIFLCSFWVQRGQAHAGDVGIALTFAGLGAVGSVALEWYFPIHGWKTQSDLWHHPRKYVVPGSLLLLSGILVKLFCF